MKKTVDIPMVDHVIQYSLPAITKNRPPNNKTPDLFFY